MPQHANVAKIAANFTLASAIETLGEASALLGAHGVAMRDFLDVITGSVFPPVYEGYGSMIAERRRARGAPRLKDVRLALEAGDAVSVPLPVASVVRDNLLDALAHGGGEQDFAVLGESRCAARAAEPSRDRSPAHRHNRRFVFPYIDAEAGMNLHTWWLFVATVFVVSAIPGRTCCW